MVKAVFSSDVCECNIEPWANIGKMAKFHKVNACLGTVFEITESKQS